MSRYFRKLAPLTAPSDEMLHIDLLRFISSYIVILYHFGPFVRGPLAPVMAHFRHFALAVDLFFILSGFIIGFVYSSQLATRADFRIFLLRRVARLAPLHLATLLFFVVLGIMAAIGFHTNLMTNYDWQCLVPNALALQAFGVCGALTFNYVNWSISAEMGMYVITPALLWLGRKSRWWPLVLSMAATILLFRVSARSANPWYEWTWHFGVLRAFPEFTLGIVLFLFRDVIGRIPAARPLLLAAMAAFAVGAMLDWPNPLLLALIAAIAIAAIACDMKRMPRDWLSALGVGGQLTYSMYMLHPVIITVLVTALGQHILHLGQTMMNWWLLLVIALIAPISYLSLELFESPARRWIVGSRRRRIAVAPPIDPAPLTMPSTAA